MIGNLGKKLGVAAAREEMRLPTEAEATDRTMELAYFGAGTLVIALALVSGVIETQMNLETGFMLVAPAALLAAGYFERKKRVAKVKRRSDLFRAANSYETKNG